MMKEQENDNEITNPLKNMKRAEPSPFLYTRIEAQLDAHRSVLAKRNYWMVRLSYALVILLVALNGAVVFMFSSADEEEVSSTELVDVSAASPEDSVLYSSIIYDFNLYENESN